MREYTLDATGLQHAQDRLEKLNRKAVKLGLEEIILQAVPFVADEQSGETLYTVNVVGQTLRYSGWSFAAELQHLRTDEGLATIIRVDPDHTLRGDHRNAQPDCDHCGHNRYRKDTYVVQHEDGTEKQVGSTCLKDFLGHDPHTMLGMLDIHLEMDRILGEFHGYRGTQTTTNLRRFVEFTAREIRLHGWLSRSRCYQERRDREASTASRVIHHLGRLKKSILGDGDLPTDEDKQLAEAALLWGREDLEDTNDYTHNLKVSLTDAVVHEKTEGIVASLIPAYQRELERRIREKRQAQIAANSQHIGEPKQRMEITVTVLTVIPLESEWGTTGLHRMIDADGNVVVWFASGSAEWLEDDKTYRVKATVKEHGEYRGCRQTVVQRVKKLEEVPE